MKRKGLLLLVLATLVAGGVFAQKVGDAANVSGKNYTIQEVKSDGSLVLKPIPEGLDGLWHNSTTMPLPMGCNFTFSGTTAVLSSKGGADKQWNTAIQKGYWKEGEPVIRNIKSTGEGKWSCEILMLTYPDKSNTPNGAEWKASRIEALPDGRISVFSSPTSGQRSTLKRQ